METLGLFEDVDRAAGAVDTLIRQGFPEEEITSITSAPYPEGVLVKGEKRSFFRWITLMGGFAGAGLGFLLAAGTAWLYPLHTGDKPIVSLFPVSIITYEFTMLFAILGTIAGMFFEMGLPGFKKRLYDPSISQGSIGILVQCRDRQEQSRAGEVLENAGAVAVRKEEKA